MATNGTPSPIAKPQTPPTPNQSSPTMSAASSKALTLAPQSDLTKDGIRDGSGPWLDQGLCLVDWGRGIDLHLFPDNMEFKGDCRTSGFRCVEMQENKPWTFQVDTYGLCVIVHMMLHNSYMEIDKKPSPDGGYVYLPKSSLKRYWKVELWKNLFVKLLNSNLATMRRNCCKI